MKLMVIPVGRSLVFSGSQAKIFRTLPITGKKYFVLRGLGPRLRMKLMVIPVGRSLVFSGSQAKIFRTLPITGKKYFVLYLRWPAPVLPLPSHYGK
jgi:hypothetical protein